MGTISSVVTVLVEEGSVKEMTAHQVKKDRTAQKRMGKITSTRICLPDFILPCFIGGASFLGILARFLLVLLRQEQEEPGSQGLERYVFK